MKTKKVGLTGRYGPRYGTSIKKKVLKVERSKNAKKKCPNCLKDGMSRLSSGVWMCKKCGTKVAGKAYKLK